MNKMEPNSGRQEDSCQNCKILQKQFHYKQQEFLHLKDGHRRLQQVLAEKLAHAKCEELCGAPCMIQLQRQL